MSSDDDRLIFGDSPLEPETEQPAGSRRPNRAFVFIAVAMAGLILIGVLALIAAWRFWLPARRAEQQAVMTQTAIAMAPDAAAATPTPTAFVDMPTPTATVTLPPTQTPVPTPTSTRVLSADGSTARETSSPTRAATTTAAASGGEATTPAAGLGGFGTAAIAVGLAGLLFAVRKLRTAS